MRKVFILASAVLLLLPLLASSQSEKGATPLSPSHALTLSPAVTRAVVVGISDYQDAGIQDLKYAHRDAEAFVQWLQSPAGGGLPEGNIQLLINEKATLAQFDAALGWLMEHSREGDNAVIYFSGHGDVDSKMIGQEGFLLFWDTNSKSYRVGAYSLYFLKLVVSTLSMQNKSKVILITDACRSGKLAGSAIDGPQITNANLAKQFSNEIKILSCQPEEVSIESEQWGGGRGAFSYHLIDGLYGLADREADGTVTLSDVDRYLEDHVTKEVAPMNQTPMTVGNKNERLAQVFPDVLAAWKKIKEGLPLQFNDIEQRGLEEEMLAAVDTVIEELYRSFLKALDEKKFFEPAGACADAWYERLIAEPALARLHSAMRRRYAAALQDEAQQAINAMMNNDLDEFNLAQGREEKYKTFSRKLERAAALLGEHHYFYPSLMARKYFFEGYLVHSENMFFRDEEVGRKALRYYWKSLEWQPDFPLAYGMIDYVYLRNIPKPDSAEYFARKALKLAPHWAGPYYDFAEILTAAGKLEEALIVIDTALMLDSNAIGSWLFKGQIYMGQNRFAEAEQMFLHAVSLDSNVVQTHQNLGGLYRDMGKYDKAEKFLLKTIEKDISLSNPPSQLAWDYGMLGGIYRFMGRYADAEKYLLMGLEQHEKVFHVWHHLGAVYLQQNRLQEAEPVIKRDLELEPDFPGTMKNLGTLHFRKGQVEEARAIFENTISRYPDRFHGYLGMAGIYANEGNYKLALEYMEKAFQRYLYCSVIKDDFDLAPLRGTPTFEALVEKYCPDQAKD